MPTAQVTTPLLHRFLAMGITMLAAVFLFLRSTGFEPIPSSDSSTLVIGYSLSGLVVALLAVAFLVFKPRVPQQGPRQSIAEYWSSPDTTQKVFLVWFLMEGAGVMGAIGYLLTGQLVSAVAMGVAIAVFWLNGPNTFAK